MRIRTALLIAAGVLIPAALLTFRLTASDHADTAANYNRIGADMTDVFIFPSATNANNVVVVMDVHGLIPAGQPASFDPGVLYQMKFDITGDYVEDLVMQARFVGTGPSQRVVISGPAKPLMTGTVNGFGRPYVTTGAINTIFSPTPGMQVFAGLRSEPFFFDLNRFFGIFPDRATPLTGQQVDLPNPDMPQVNGFRGFPANSGFDSSPGHGFLPQSQRAFDRRRGCPGPCSVAARSLSGRPPASPWPRRPTSTRSRTGWHARRSTRFWPPSRAAGMPSTTSTTRPTTMASSRMTSSAS